MPPKRAKKKAQAGNTRGFATTSIPAKVRNIPEEATASDLDKTHATPQSAKIDVADQLLQNERDEANKLLAESLQIVEHGDRIFTRMTAEIDVEKRSRKNCIQLSLPESSVDRILLLAASQARTRHYPSTSTLETLKNLYAVELLLQRAGYHDEVVKQVLLDVPNIADPAASLFHVSYERPTWRLLTI